MVLIWSLSSNPCESQGNEIGSSDLIKAMGRLIPRLLLLLLLPLLLRLRLMSMREEVNQLPMDLR